MLDWPNVFVFLRVHSCLVSLDCVTLWTCKSLKGTQRDCESVYVAIAVVGLTMVTPQRTCEDWLDEGAIRWHYLVYLCRCGDGPLRPGVVQPGDTPH